MAEGILLTFSTIQNEQSGWANVFEKGDIGFKKNTLELHNEKNIIINFNAALFFKDF